MLLMIYEDMPFKSPK